MTILVCQKRHHKPHWLGHMGWPFYQPITCDGLPRWPYARPKPLRNGMTWGYIEEQQTMFITQNLSREPFPWVVYFINVDAQVRAPFPTHAEAIEYAQNLVNERKKNSGTW